MKHLPIRSIVGCWRRCERLFCARFGLPSVASQGCPPSSPLPGKDTKCGGADSTRAYSRRLFVPIMVLAAVALCAAAPLVQSKITPAVIGSTNHRVGRALHHSSKASGSIVDSVDSVDGSDRPDLRSASKSAATRANAFSPLVREVVVTSTREVTSLAVEPDGTLWVGTTGGVLRYGRSGAGRNLATGEAVRRGRGSGVVARTGWEWRKFTRRDGLPAHETLRIRVSKEVVTAEFPRGAAVWTGGRWRVKKAGPRLSRVADDREDETCAAVWRGRQVEAALAGLRLREGRIWRTVPLPNSRGTHISALLPRGSELWAALFGDGLWTFNGKSWRPVNIGLPSGAHEITALAAHGSTLWLGTRRAGVWEYDGHSWTQHLQPDEPLNHNAQAFAVYRDRLFVSTLENGLAIRSAAGWRAEIGPHALLGGAAPDGGVPGSTLCAARQR